MAPTSHDLIDFMTAAGRTMAEKYERIRKRATEDPGTAGDQGEENWAELLRNWLPSHYRVVTKGRILGIDGTASPQVDVIVLHPAYPLALVNEKLYLAGGVAAAFECKLTLKASHVTEAVKTGAAVKALCPTREGTPYRELHAPIVYGLLAHSHSWKGAASVPSENISSTLAAADAAAVDHPRNMLDLLCVADHGCWNTMKTTFVGPRQVPDWTPMIPVYGAAGAAATAYAAHTPQSHAQSPSFTPVGVLVNSLSQKLGWEHPEFRGLADYYRLANIGGTGGGRMRTWPASIYSPAVRSRVEAGGLTNRGYTWDEWGIAFA